MIKTLIDNSKIVNKNNYDYISNYNNNLAIIRKDNKYGFIDKNGNIIIKPIYFSVEHFNCDVSIVSLLCNDKKLFGLIDKEGNYIIEPKYDMISGFKNGYSWFCLDGKYGVINNCGKVIIPPKYKSPYYSYPTDDKIIILKDNYNKNVIVDINGNELFNHEEDEIIPFENNSFTIIKSSNNYKKFGLIDTKGNIILNIQDKYLIESKVKYNMIVVKMDNKYYIIDEFGISHNMPNYDNVCILYYDTLIATKDNECFLTDINGNPKNDKRYNRIFNLKNDYAIVRKDGKYGFIDKYGNEVIGPIYSYVSYFEDGLATVCLDGKYGVIDCYGNVVIDIVYNNINSYKNGYFCIEKNKKYGYVSSDGKRIVLKKESNIPIWFDVFGKIGKRYIVLYDSEKCCYAILDNKYNELFKVPFRSIKINDNMVVIDNKYILREEDFKLIHNLKLNNVIDKNFESLEKCILYNDLFKEELQLCLSNTLYKDIESNIDEKILYKK